MNRRDKIIQLRKEGLTIRQIVKRLRLSSTALDAYYLDQEKEPLFRVSKTKLVALMRRIAEEASTDYSSFGRQINILVTDLLASTKR